MPAGWLAVIGCVLVGAALGTQVLDDLRWEALSSATFWTNWLFLSRDVAYSDLFSSPSPFDHFWSLAIEAQLYVVVPPVLWLLWRLVGVSRLAAWP